MVFRQSLGNSTWLRRLPRALLRAGAALLAVATISAGAATPSATPAGQLAAVTGRGLLLIADVAGARPRVIGADPVFTRSDAAAGWRLAWSRDDPQLAIGTPAGDLVVAAPSGIRARVPGVWGFAWGDRSLYVLTAAGLGEVRSDGTVRAILPIARLTVSGGSVAIVAIRGSAAILARPAVEASAYGGPTDVLALDLRTLRLSRIGATTSNMFPQEPTLDAGGRVLFIAGVRGGYCMEWHGSVGALRSGRSRTLFASPARPGSKAGVDILSLAPTAGSVWFTAVDFDDGSCFAASGDQAQHGRVGVFDPRTGKTAFLPLAVSSVEVDLAGTRLAAIDAIVTFRSEYPEVAPGTLVTASPQGTSLRTLLDGAVAVAWRPAPTS